MFIFSSCLNASDSGQVNIRIKELDLLNALKNKIPFLVSNKFVAIQITWAVSLFSEVLNQVEIKPGSGQSIPKWKSLPFSSHIDL